MIHVLLLEDSKEASGKIRSMLEGLYPGQFKYHYAVTIDPADEDVCDIDILFADIELTPRGEGSGEGIKIARDMKLINPALQVIFVSAFHRYAQDIFIADPVQYIQKPIDEKILKAAVDKALINLNQDKEKQLSVKHSGNIIKISFRKIICIESDRRLINIRTADGTLSIYRKLRDIEGCMDDTFFRVHQSFLVNMAHIRSYEGNELCMSDGSSVPVSRSRARSFYDAYTRFLGDKLK